MRVKTGRYNRGTCGKACGCHPHPLRLHLVGDGAFRCVHWLARGDLAQSSTLHFGWAGGGIDANMLFLFVCLICFICFICFIYCLFFIAFICFICFFFIPKLHFFAFFTLALGGYSRICLQLLGNKHLLLCMLLGPVRIRSSLFLPPYQLFCPSLLPGPPVTPPSNFDSLRSSL